MGLLAHRARLSGREVDEGLSVKFLPEEPLHGSYANTNVHRLSFIRNRPDMSSVVLFGACIEGVVLRDK